MQIDFCIKIQHTQVASISMTNNSYDAKEILFRVFVDSSFGRFRRYRWSTSVSLNIGFLTKLEIATKWRHFQNCSAKENDVFVYRICVAENARLRSAGILTIVTSNYQNVP